MKQKGFATLEVILMIVVIAILASIAVPRFSEVSAKANTAKIQADLSTIDTAIAVYQLEMGKDPGNAVSTLVNAGYLQAEPKPPSGKCYIVNTTNTTNTTPVNVPGSGSYSIVEKSGNIEAHAELGGKKASDFRLPQGDTTNNDTTNNDTGRPGQ